MSSRTARIASVSATSCARSWKCRAKRMMPPVIGWSMRRMSASERVVPATSSMTGPGMRFNEFKLRAKKSGGFCCRVWFGVWFGVCLRTNAQVYLRTHARFRDDKRHRVITFIGDRDLGGDTAHRHPVGQFSRHNNLRLAARLVERLQRAPCHRPVHTQSDRFRKRFFRGETRREEGEAADFRARLTRVVNAQFVSSEHLLGEAPFRALHHARHTAYLNEIRTYSVDRHRWA